MQRWRDGNYQKNAKVFETLKLNSIDAWWFKFWWWYTKTRTRGFGLIDDNVNPGHGLSIWGYSSNHHNLILKMALSRLNSRLVFIHPGLTFLNPKPRYHDLPGHVEKRWWPTMAFGSVKNPTTPLKNHTFRQWKTTPLFKHVLYRNLHLRDVPACHVSLRRSTSACYLSIVPGYGPWINPCFGFTVVAVVGFETLKKPTKIETRRRSPI